MKTISDVFNFIYVQIKLFVLQVHLFVLIFGSQTFVPRRLVSITLIWCRVVVVATALARCAAATPLLLSMRAAPGCVAHCVARSEAVASNRIEAVAENAQFGLPGWRRLHYLSLHSISCSGWRRVQIFI